MSQTTYKIRRVKNGFILEAKYSDGEKVELVGREDDVDETDCFIAFLQDIVEQFGPMNGRYSEKRIRVIAVPGDKFTGELSLEYYKQLKYIQECIGDVLYPEGTPGTLNIEGRIDPSNLPDAEINLEDLETK